MKRLQHVIEYTLLLSVAAVVRRMPLSTARFIARRLGDLVYYAVPIRKTLVLAHLRAAFPEKNDGERRTIARAVYHQFAQTMMELLFFPRLGTADLARMVDLRGLDVLVRARAIGKGAVLVGAHFGNWELMGAALAQVHPVTFVVGQQENGMVDDLLNAYRAAKGVRIIPLKMALRGVMKTLKANEFIAILADQDAHEQGTFVPFFGRPASTPKGPALFALRAGCPMIMGTIVRNPDGRFTVLFEDIPRPAPSGDEEQDIRAYTAAYTSMLERHTRQHPDHWFWLHRRWKTKLTAPEEA